MRRPNSEPSESEIELGIYKMVLQIPRGFGSQVSRFSSFLLSSDNVLKIEFADDSFAYVYLLHTSVYAINLYIHLQTPILSLAETSYILQDVF